VRTDRQARPVLSNDTHGPRYDRPMVTGAVLAGGQAARFGGQDKSALVVGGHSLLHTLVERLTDLTDDVLVVGRRDAPSDVATSTRLLEDRAPGCGPLGGLDTAMAHARYDTVVLVACDMPYVTVPLLAHLAALIHRSSGTHVMDAVVPRTQRGYHPLCAAYRRTCHDAVIGRLADRRLRMKGLLEDLRVKDVSRDELMEFGDPDRLLTNINTAQDYDALLRYRL